MGEEAVLLGQDLLDNARLVESARKMEDFGELGRDAWTQLYARSGASLNEAARR